MSVKRTASIYALSALLVMNLAGTATLGYAADLVKSDSLAANAKSLEEGAAPSEASPAVEAPSIEKPVVPEEPADDAAVYEGPDAGKPGDSVQNPPEGKVNAAGPSASATGASESAGLVLEEGPSVQGADEVPGASDAEGAASRDAAQASPAEAAVASASATAIEAAAAAVDSPVTLEGSTLYANGVAIVVKKDADGKAYVFDGTGSQKLLEQSVGSLTVYGGSKNKPVQGDTSVTLDGVSASTVYGGGYSDGSGNADVSGNVTVTVKGTVNAGEVHGGGNAVATKGDASANVKGAVSVVVGAIPTSNHDSLYGGGKATTSGAYSASATAGSTSLHAVGRLYSARGGGWAEAAASGSACADVRGSVACALDNADAREVYGGGFARGAQANARAASVSIALSNTEVMLAYGGGTASAGCADVAGLCSTTIASSPNLYGYTVGGGQASDGGSADVGSASIAISDSEGPVEEQFPDYWAAQAVYAGGEASGAGSHANVLGAADVSIVGGHMAGNVYGSGSGSSGASTTVGSASVTLDGVLGFDFDKNGVPETGRLSVFAAGEADGASATLAQGPSTVQLNNTEVEHLWGAVTAEGGPTVAPGGASVRLKGTAARTTTLACVDSVEVDAPLRVAMFLWKAEGVPTTVIVHGIATHQPAVICDDADSAATWFALEGGTFDYAIEEGKSVWRVAERRASLDVEAGEGAASKPQVTVVDSEELADKLLSDQDRADLKSGKSVGFKVRVEDVTTGELDAKTREALVSTAKSSDCTVALPLNIEILKVLDGVEHPMSTTPVPVRLTFPIPEEYLSSKSDSMREFSVIRIHENSDGTMTSTVLPDLDDARETVTIESSDFSVYALAYADKSNSSTPPADQTNPEDGKGGDGGKKTDENENKNANKNSAGDEGDEKGAVDVRVIPPAQTPQERAAAVYRNFGVRAGDDAAALVYTIGGIALVALNVAAIGFLRSRARGTRRG